MMSNEYNAHFESLVAKLRDDNPHIQILTHLVMHALIKQLSGEHQIDAAHRILETIDYEQISAIQSLSEDASELLQVSLTISSHSHIESSHQGLDGEELARHTVVKPSSKSTLLWLQLAVIAVTPSISAPPLPLDWTADLDSVRLSTISRMWTLIVPTDFNEYAMPTIH